MASLHNGASQHSELATAVAATEHTFPICLALRPKGAALKSAQGPDA